MKKNKKVFKGKVKKDSCEMCHGEKVITRNAGLDNEYYEKCSECVGVDDTDMSGACGSNDR